MVRGLSAFGMSGLMASSLLFLGCDAPQATNNGGDAGLVVSTDGGSSADADEKAKLEEIAKAMRDFRQDTSGWPVGGAVWRPVEPTGMSPSLNPTEFTDADVALFKTAKILQMDGQTPSQVELPVCGTDKSNPCWSGPYLLGGVKMTDTNMLDKWGHKRLFAIIRPNDQWAFSSVASPEGAVILWSAGPDGLDQTGCTATQLGSPGCTLDIEQLVLGKSSGGGDDIVVVVSPNAK